jgi:aspartyl-tRNA(Asn)/glutamyl-tRNA(Gln) amidotransferase subunit A
MVESSDKYIAAGVSGLASLFRDGHATPVDVLEAYLNRIGQHNRSIGAICDIDERTCLQGAEQSMGRWKKRNELSSIDGVPIAVKSNIAVAGLPWTAGIGSHANRVADGDAECVRILRAAGAIIIGTTNMHEGALGGTNDNPWFGRTDNPRRPGYTPGGSSGGSAAAVAAGFCAAALGTDTIGSVRIPASYCGVFGHKPSQDFISRKGIVPLSNSLDHVGIIARSAWDCFQIMETAAEIRLTSNTYPTFRGRRIAVIGWEPETGIQPAIDRALEATTCAAKRLGTSVEKIRLKSYDYGHMQRLAFRLAEMEGAEIHKADLNCSPAGFSQSFTEMLVWGARQGCEKHANTLEEIETAASAVREELAGFDAVISPTTPQTSFKFDSQIPDNQAMFTTLASCLRLPATAFPVGTTDDGLPVSIQVMAANESYCLQLAGILARY